MVIYLMIYKVNYTFETKYKVFEKFEEATKFHQNYQHHILKDAYITHYEIQALSTKFIQTVG